MTEKAQTVLYRLNQREAFENWKRIGNPERRKKFLDDFNRDNKPDVGPLGGKQGMKVLQDMNDLDAGNDEFVKSLAP